MKVLQYGKHLEIYHIGTTEEVPIRDVALEIAATLNFKINLRSCFIILLNNLWLLSNKLCFFIVCNMKFIPIKFENKPINMNTNWYFTRKIAAAENPIIGRMSEIWWAQQAAIDVVETPPDTETDVAASAFLYDLT